MLSDDTKITAESWLDQVFGGPFKGREGVVALLSSLIERGAEPKIGGEEGLPTLGVYLPINDKRVRVLAFHHHISSGRRSFSITFGSFPDWISFVVRQEFANHLRITGMRNEITLAAERNFTTKLKSDIDGVFVHPDRVDMILDAIEALMLAMERQSKR
jgi:hypothetical protein